VLPEFKSPHGHLRARVCWLIQYFCHIKLNNKSLMGEILQQTVNSLLWDRDPPVKVEAAMALKKILTVPGESVVRYVEPHIQQITLELLTILRNTENDELTAVMRRIVCTYSKQLLPIMGQICHHLADTFIQILESGNDAEDKSVTVMGLLNTMETVLRIMEKNPPVHRVLEPIILKPIKFIFSNTIVEYYEEAMSLCCDLTSQYVSSDMWKMLEVTYNLLQRDGYEYFCEMMPALHNYVTVDTNAFLSTPDNMMCMFNMCKAMMEGAAGEVTECHAAKLLEVIILQCKGRNIDEVIPIFVELVVSRLTKHIRTIQLRTRCVQVIIAALYYNPRLLLESLDNIQIPGLQGSVFGHFVNQFIHNTEGFTGVHDQKLCVLGVVHLMQIPESPVVMACARHILPRALILFQGLNQAYSARRKKDEDSEEESDSDVEEAVSEEKVPSLEAYSTPLNDDEAVDEYIIFKEALSSLQNFNPRWFTQMTGHLNTAEAKILAQVVGLAELRMTERENKKIEETGGYQFLEQTGSEDDKRDEKEAAVVPTMQQWASR